jgi:hypothetical protein
MKVGIFIVGRRREKQPVEILERGAEVSNEVFYPTADVRWTAIETDRSEFMTRITFIILAHEDADHVIRLAKLLTEWSSDAHAVIHYDLSSSEAEFRKIEAEFLKSPAVHLVDDRVRCGWGDFSLVEAVLRGLRLVRDRKIASDRVMLVSGACMPIRPLAQLSAFLDAHPDTEYIEAFDADWITGGMRHGRYQYYHLVNSRRRPALFRRLIGIQRFLKIKRRLPAGLIPKFGSQWWTLTWPLCAKILELLDSRPDVYRYFRTTWIPDELFFQTLAHHLVPSGKMAGHSLTFYQFNGGGRPLVFSDRHAPLLRTLPHFFARKIESGADELKKQLGEIARGACEPDASLPELQPRWRFPAEEPATEHGSPRNGYTGLFADDDTRKADPRAGDGSEAEARRADLRRRRSTIGARSVAQHYERFRQGLFSSLRMRVRLDRSRQIRKDDVLLLACHDRWDESTGNFLDYYRTRGVGHFLLIDHGKERACEEIARHMPDVTVYTASGGFREARNGDGWRNVALRRHGRDHFCVLADPGEYLVFPFQESRTIGELADFLKNERKDALHGIRIDGYARNAGDVEQTDNGNPFAVCPYFDGDGYYRRDIGDGMATVVGGPSLRLSDGAQPHAAPLLNRIVGVWWARKYHLLGDGRTAWPIKLNRVFDGKTPVVSAAMFRFPEIDAAKGGRSLEDMIRTYGKDVADTVSNGRSLYLEGVSTSFQTSGDLMQAGLISPGNWI